MSFTELLARNLFGIIAALGRPIGGVRPRRLAHRLSQLGYGRTPPNAEDYRWYTDRHGLRMRLHPYFLIDREVIAFGAYELPLQRFIQKTILPGMVCMDVGANIGAVSLHLALRTGPEGKVFAFEPVPANAARLRENCQRNNLCNWLQVVEVALSDQNASLALLIASAAHSNQGMGSLVEVDHGDLCHQISVESQTLDSFCETNSVGRLDFIKVDIQGAEPLFIQGAKQTLRRLKPTLVMEVAPSSMGATGFASNDLIALMESLGYSAFLLDSKGTKKSVLSAQFTPPGFTAGNVLFEPI